MFTDTLLTILVIYSFAFFITGILMIILEPKGDENRYQQKVTEYTMLAIGSVATLSFSIFGLTSL
ncbi:hypothetical protein ABMY35_14505 [Pseudoalteromonas sp. BZB3]|uniref:hypothetical protein n=1 Tax=unclassified Pseudoalteromonas TaxID=194690 RepID=UPI0032C3D77B|tara:strand:- start:1057 stop:1251 length:195 start_codon:yes stop_codon:yes gene_type:complete